MLVVTAGNWATAGWLAARGLAPPRQQLLEHLLPLDPAADVERATICALQQVLADRPQQHLAAGADLDPEPPVQWTPGLRAALVRLRDLWAPVNWFRPPWGMPWLEALLVQAVEGELLA